jgi:hypothetical protein
MVPYANISSLNEMKLRPDLYYIITCAFLFYVFMCGTLLESLVGKSVRTYIRQNTWIKHALAFVVLVFTIGIVTDLPDVFTMLWASAAVYLWFLVVGKLPAAWNLVLILLLLVCFCLNESIRKHYSLEWVHSTPNPTVMEARKRQHNQLIRISTGLGLGILGASVLMSLWFFAVPMRARGVAWYHQQSADAQVQWTSTWRGKLWYALYQPHEGTPIFSLLSVDEVPSSTAPSLQDLLQEAPQLRALLEKVRKNPALLTSI